MNIYIDESGVFKTAEHQDAWCVVAAYMETENNFRNLKSLLVDLKLKCGRKYDEEIKLKDVSEALYIEFLDQLNLLNGTLYATATDMSLIKESDVVNHRNIQAEKVVEHKEKMIHESMKKSLQDLSDQIKGLSPQLYMQLVCLINLIVDIINRGVLYYVQRNPQYLRKFKWRIDQKNSNKCDFAIAFQRMSPVILQSISLEKPFIELEGADYSPMDRFKYEELNCPTYLREVYDIDVDTTNSFNIGMILNEDLSFEDSKRNIGVQVSDLLASGIRRLLRGEFENQELVSKAIGKLTISNLKGSQSINLISFTESFVTNRTTGLVINTLNKNAKSIFNA